MTIYCALCMHLLADGRGRPPGELLENPSVLSRAAVTVVNGHAACRRHFPYLRWPRDLDESAQVALGDGVDA